MRYTIPIVPEVTQENARQVWTLSVAKRKEQLKSKVVIGIVSVIVACLVHEVVWKAILITSAVYLLITAINIVVFLNKGEKQYLYETAKLYNESGEMIVELTNDHFLYSDHIMETKTAWSMLDRYVISGNLLYITFKTGIGYMINKKLVSATEFDEMVAFIQGKM